MSHVSYEQYTNEKFSFIKRHKNLMTTHTSNMENDKYLKTYVCNDGKVFYENIYPIYEDVETTTKGLVWKFQVKLMCVEFWSSDSPSKFYYERW